jgi:hypothetical protein
MAEIRLKNQEGTHRLLYEAHWDLSRAGDKIHATIVALADAERWIDQREAAAPITELLRTARDAIQDAQLRLVGEARMALIKNTGCDGSCTEPRTAPSQVSE